VFFLVQVLIFKLLVSSVRILDLSPVFLPSRVRSAERFSFHAPPIFVSVSRASRHRFAARSADPHTGRGSSVRALEFTGPGCAGQRVSRSRTPHRFSSSVADPRRKFSFPGFGCFAISSLLEISRFQSPPFGLCFLATVIDRPRRVNLKALVDFIADQASVQRRQRTRSPCAILFFGFGFLLVFSPVLTNISAPSSLRCWCPVLVPAAVRQGFDCHPSAPARSETSPARTQVKVLRKIWFCLLFSHHGRIPELLLFHSSCEFLSGSCLRIGL
jgi:hypothetical protein